MSRSQPPPPIARALSLATAGGKGWLRAHAILVAVQGAIPLLGVYLMQLLVDAIATGTGADDRWAAFSHVLVLVGLAAAVAMTGALLGAAEGVIADAHGRAVADAVATRLHQQSARIDLAYYENPAHYDTLHRAQQEAPQRPVRIVRELSGLGRSIVLLIGMGGLLFALHWAVPLLVVAAAIPAVLVRLRTARELYDWQFATSPEQRETNYLSMLLTGRAAAKEVRAFDLGAALSARFDRIRSRLRGEHLRLALRRGKWSLLAQVLSGLVLFAAYAWLGWLTLGSVITLGGLVMYAQAIQRCQGAVQGVLGALAGLGEHRLFLTHFFALLDLPTTMATPKEPRPVPRPMRQGVRCEGVVFRYPGQTEPVLRGVDLTIAPGEQVGLVGPNGAGKSTLVRLLCRLHDPEAGSIRCDGIDLRQFDPTAWRARLGVLFQDAVPLEFTARENVTLDLEGSGDADGAAVAMRLSGIDDRLARLPQGIDTRLGRRFPGGQDLSVGEWRKLILARTLYRSADLLILDEPSAALDPRAEVEVIERLWAATADKAMLIVSHRPASLSRCDRICVMEGGRIVRSGSPGEILTGDGSFPDRPPAPGAATP